MKSGEHPVQPRLNPDLTACLFLINR